MGRGRSYSMMAFVLVRVFHSMTDEEFMAVRVVCEFCAIQVFVWIQVSAEMITSTIPR